MKNEYRASTGGPGDPPDPLMVAFIFALMAILLLLFFIQPLMIGGCK